MELCTEVPQIEVKITYELPLFVGIDLDRVNLRDNYHEHFLCFFIEVFLHAHDEITAMECPGQIVPVIVDLVLIPLPQCSESLVMLTMSALVALNVDYQIAIVHFFECVVDTLTPLLLVTCLSICYLMKSIKRF